MSYVQPSILIPLKLLLFLRTSFSIFDLFVSSSSDARTCCPQAPSTLVPTVEFETSSGPYLYRYRTPFSNRALKKSGAWILIAAANAMLLVIGVSPPIKQSSQSRLNEPGERYIKEKGYQTTFGDNEASEVKPRWVHCTPSIFVMQLDRRSRWPLIGSLNIFN